MLHLKNALCAMALCALAGCVHTPPLPDMRHAVTPPAQPAASTLPVLLDDRIYVEISFTRPDGGRRAALAFVNMGSGPLILSNGLFRELQPKAGQALHLQFGAMDIAIDGSAVQPEAMANNMTISVNPFAKTKSAEELAQTPDSVMTAMSAPLKVEAVLPAGVLQHFEVVFDYAAQSMTLATPGSLKPEGVAVPVRLNPKTGFVTLDATIAGKTTPLVLDIGGSFSALRDAAPLLDEHREWLRSVGGIGPANLLMDPSRWDAVAPVLKIPNVSLGALRIEEFGAMVPGPQGWFGRRAADLFFWDMIYSDKAGETVDGWIGGNVLKSFRLTIDYQRHMTYWQQIAPIDRHDLDQVGVVLGRMNGATTIAGIASKSGVATVEGVEPGDTLLKIGDVDTATLTRGGLVKALHGTPGERKKLILERTGKQFAVDATVTGF